MSITKSAPTIDTGLVAIGRSKSWEVGIDRTTVGNERWFMQIESPTVYLYFEIDDRKVVDDILSHDKVRRQTAKERSASKPDSVILGRFGSESVSLLWDDESNDRFFVLIGDSPEHHLRLSFTNDSYRQLIEAFNQLKDELSS